MTERWVGACWLLNAEIPPGRQSGSGTHGRREMRKRMRGWMKVQLRRAEDIEKVQGRIMA